LDHDYGDVAPIAGAVGAGGHDFDVNVTAALEIGEKDFLGTGDGADAGPRTVAGIVREGSGVDGLAADRFDLGENLAPEGVLDTEVFRGRVFPVDWPPVLLLMS